LTIPKELELDIPDANKADVKDRIGSSQGSISENECTQDGKGQLPPLTPNRSSSSPMQVQTPEEQRPAPSGALDAPVKQPHGSLLVLDAEAHRNVDIKEKTALKLQPSFELNAKRPSVKDDDSPESRPRRVCTLLHFFGYLVF